MINTEQTYFLIQRDFILKYGSIGQNHVENVYCAFLDRVPNYLNKLKLWKHAARQDKQAIHIIMDYEKTNGKTN